MNKKYSDDQLYRIIDQAIIYQCACPAQVATLMRELRQVAAYQENCLELTDTDKQVHQRISDDVRQAHATLEACLGAVLHIEGWDLDTMTMPSDLHKLMVEQVSTGK